MLIKSHEVGQAPQAPGRYEALGSEIGALVDEKQRAYGDSFGKMKEIIRAFLQDYYDHDYNGYTYLPRKLIEEHLPVLIRMWDKQNRIVANPNGDRMDESPYRDIAGYALLAVAREEGK